jgi:hypothetical protein
MARSSLQVRTPEWFGDDSASCIFCFVKTQ